MLSPAQQERYQRQLIIPEIDQAGQERLAGSRVLIAGVGGLGSISAYYLAAAGVGGLRIVDHDRVQLSNLNRQIMHRTTDLDRPKTESAREKLDGLNPECRVEGRAETLTRANAAQLAQGCQLILDATDNLAARLALNAASLALGIPLIYGGIDGFSGMVTTFCPPRTACLECLFPAGPERPAGPIGALGPMAGAVASLQCLEAVKLLLGLAPALADRLLRFDGRTLAFKTTQLTKNPACLACGGRGDGHGPDH